MSTFIPRNLACKLLDINLLSYPNFVLIAGLFLVIK